MAMLIEIRNEFVVVDSIYPLNRAMADNPDGPWQNTAARRITEYLGKAKGGDRSSEIRLCNLIGQIRRSSPKAMNLKPCLSLALRQATAWLRATGRKVDLGNRDPGNWITERDGKTKRF